MQIGTRAIASWLKAMLAIVLAASATTSDAQTPERRGPQIRPTETVDWTSIDSIASVQLPGMAYTRRLDGERSDFKATETLELKFFPAQKLVSFEIVPRENASLHCSERGQTFDLMFLASPGAQVSDQIQCSGQNLERYQIRMSYSTTATFTADTLSITGTATIDRQSIGSRGQTRTSYKVELQGAVQITGATCRIVSWRQTVNDTDSTQFANGVRIDGASAAVLESTPVTGCRVVQRGS